MKKFLGVLAAVMFMFGVFGCAKKQVEEAQEPMTMEAMSTVNVANPGSTETKAKAPVVQTEEKLPLPPAGPFKPTPTEIQSALKNAGFYTGEIDGKIGPKTKKAIEAFQKANNLKVDGRIGHKTWELLKTHLTAEQSAPEKK